MLVHGCKIRLSGCDARVFYVPLTSEEESKNRVESVSTTFGIKNQGLAARTATLSGSSDGRKGKDPSFLECIVISPQPLLRLRDTSLTQGALMLYEGETYVERYHCCICFACLQCLQVLNPPYGVKFFVSRGGLSPNEP
jgi:hypothetical protein